MTRLQSQVVHSTRSSMTAAQHALLKRVHSADAGLGVLLPMDSGMVQEIFASRWIKPGEFPWCRDQTRLRFRLTAVGRTMMERHEQAARELHRISRRRLPRA
ncbi:hypothetical protein ABMY26_00700 (plasmid) [Azospirillum sp. HJ39]|uniref:hypothetical protein n=1 Tax=Azospirillum sp. HJ39 TaxID=3159496 RepID=UPI00355810A8